MRQIILDTETTGFEYQEGHRLIEVGCIEMIDRRLTGQYLHFYVNPEREIDEGAVAIHGLTQEFLSDKPLFKDIAVDLYAFLKGAELVIHNAPFDIGFLNHEYGLLPSSRVLDFVPWNLTDVLDTLILARKKHPGQRNSLDALCKRYQVDATGRTFHGALLDAELLAQVYLRMTGGQEKLAFLNQEVLEAQIQYKRIALAEGRRFKVISATHQELEAHQQKIQALGQEVWL
jgi:DNA polymerase-3 subunit epsilon